MFKERYSDLVNRSFARLAFAALLAVIANALIQSGLALSAGRELKDAIPVIEAPIASFGKAIGAFFTAWISSDAVFSTPFGSLDVKKTASYTIYEWIKLPIILYLTTFGMTLLRMRVGTKRIEATLGRNDFGGVMGGTFLGMLTPVCSCTVTNLYAGLVAGGASRRASAAFLFASPALNEFAIIFMFASAGLVGGSIYLVFGIIASIITAYSSKAIGLDPARFLDVSMARLPDFKDEKSLLVRAHIESGIMLSRLMVAILISGFLAAILTNYNLTLVQSLTQAGHAWYGPIVATVIGLPLDINAASTAPILLSLNQVVPLGTLIAAMMATTVASIPEVTMLNKLIGAKSTGKLVALYAFYTISIGLLINFLFAA